MAGSTLHLYKINHTFYFRIRVPVDLMQHFSGKQELKRSLHTKNSRQAKSLLRLWDARTEELFTMIRTGLLTADQINELADRYFHGLLATWERRRGEGGGTPKGTLTPEHLRQNALSLIPVYRKGLAVNDFSLIAGVVEEELNDSGITPEPESPQYTMLARELMKRFIEALQVESERVIGNYTSNGYDEKVTSHKQQPAVAPVVTQSQKESPLLSAVIPKFLDDYRRKESANNNTMKEYQSACELFLQIVGDRPVQEISRDDMRNYLAILVKLPPHMKRSKAYRGKSIAEVVAMGVQKTLNPATIEKSHGVIKSLLTWLVDEGELDRNVAERLPVPKSKARPDELRSVFDKDDLIRMIEGLQIEAEAGSLKDRPERLWLPLIALFSGMRLNEIAQLHVADVRKDDESGVWYFSLNADGEGKKLKTSSARRPVPVHPVLVELGLMDYLERVQAGGHSRLWLNLSQSDRGYAKTFSNWFNRTSSTGFLRERITDDPKKNFHSFRHMIVNHFKQEVEGEDGFDYRRVKEIIGHADPTMTTGWYGKRYNVGRLYETLSKVDYGVDFTPLKAVAEGIGGLVAKSVPGLRKKRL